MLISGRPVSWTEAGISFITVFRGWWKQAVTNLETNTSGRFVCVCFFFCRFTCCFFFSLRCCCCEPTCRINGELQEPKIVQKSQRHHCAGHQSNRLSGCIIWLHYLPLAAAAAWIGSRKRSDWKARGIRRWWEWAEPVMYDKIQQFHCTWKSRGESRKKRFFMLRKWRTEGGKADND